MPETPTIFRLKVLFVGIYGLGAGLLFLTSGLEGSVLSGGLMVAGCRGLSSTRVRGELGRTGCGQPVAANPSVKRRTNQKNSIKLGGYPNLLKLAGFR